MKCEEIKNFIIDYIDGEIDEAGYKNIKVHLDTCASCRRLEQSLRQAVIDPVKRAERVDLPEGMWQRISDRIQRPSFKWTDALRIKKPLLVPVAVALVLFVVAFFLKEPPITENMLNEYIGENLDFLSELVENGDESYYTVEDIDLGTAIEKYLL